MIYSRGIRDAICGVSPDCTNTSHIEMKLRHRCYMLMAHMYRWMEQPTPITIFSTSAQDIQDMQYSAQVLSALYR